MHATCPHSSPVWCAIMAFTIKESVRNVEFNYIGRVSQIRKEALHAKSFLRTFLERSRALLERSLEALSVKSFLTSLGNPAIVCTLACLCNVNALLETTALSIPKQTKNLKTYMISSCGYWYQAYLFSRRNMKLLLTLHKGMLFWLLFRKATFYCKPCILKS